MSAWLRWVWIVGKSGMVRTGLSAGIGVAWYGRSAGKDWTG